MGRKIAPALTLALAPALLAAQEPVFRSEVRLVRLLVTAQDSGGHPVGGLSANQFRVLDSGAEQSIAVFEAYTEQPLSISLLVDTSGSTAKELTYEVDAALRFLRALTREGNPLDALSVYSFNHDVTLQTGFTRNLARVEKALGRLRAQAGTSLYDAIQLASDPLADRQGRRVMIVISDGGDTTSARTFADALRSLHAADAILYPIVVLPVTNDAGRNVGGENALVTLAQSTGGRIFYPAGAAALQSSFEAILRDLRTQYLLGYYPRGLPPSKEAFRRVEVRLQDANLRAVTRSGYYEK